MNSRIAQPKRGLCLRPNGVPFALVFALLLSSASPLFPQAVWSGGQAARLVIGQPHFTRQSPAPSREIIGSAQGVAVAGDRLVIVDSNKVGAVPNSNRVLIYNGLSDFIPELEEELAQDGICPVCVGVPDVVLGQPDFDSFDPSRAGLNKPLAAASDGVRLAVADTDNNRVLIWNTIPFANGTSPDVVVGQPDLETGLPATSRTGMRGPQGVWIDNNRLFVADTQNGRVLIYNSIPTSNGAQADIVLGQPDFDTRPEPDLTQTNVPPSATAMLDPTSVSVSNGRLFVTDLAFNRVMIYFTVPQQNNFPADVAVGQPDLESATINNAEEVCEALPDDGNEDTEEPRYPVRCAATLAFPRAAISDGTRLYVADGGNDRVLIFEEIPMSSGASAGHVLGQPDFETLMESDGAASLRAPSSLAHDGTNLYVADPFSRRILVFTPAEDMIVKDGLRNAASVAIRANAFITFQGNVNAGDRIPFSVNDREYEFVGEDGQTAENIRDYFLEQINNDPEAPVFAQPFLTDGTYAEAKIKFSGATRAGDVISLQVENEIYDVTVAPEDSVMDMVDIFSFFINNRPDPLVFGDRDVADVDTLILRAREIGPAGDGIFFSITGPPDSPLQIEASGDTTAGAATSYALRLFAKEAGPAGNDIAIDQMVPANIGLDRSGGFLTGGHDARQLPAGTLASIYGTDLADTVASAQLVDGRLPTELDGVRVYVNGKLVPLYFVSPEQINFQVPFEVAGTSLSAYVWRRTEQGIRVSVARAADVPRFAPGLFAFPGEEPRRAVAVHAGGAAQGTVAIAAVDENEETVDAGVVATVRVMQRDYLYTTQEGDTPESVRDRLVEIINAGDGDPDVVASPGREGFFSARATITLEGEINAGDSVEVTIRDRVYRQVVLESDSLVAVRNKLVETINTAQGTGLGDSEVTARRLDSFASSPILQVVARVLGVEGNEIPFAVTVNEGAQITATSDDAGEGFLTGGQTPPVVTLTARDTGRQGNAITYSAETSNQAVMTVVARGAFLCCGNEPFALISDENPAIPGEMIVVFATGLGLTAPLPQAEGLDSGQIVPTEPLFQVPFVADDFVASQAGGRTASLLFSGLMPGTVGVYQINLRLNPGMRDDPAMFLWIAQGPFISNIGAIPVKNLRPTNEITF